MQAADAVRLLLLYSHQRSVGLSLRSDAFHPENWPQSNKQLAYTTLPSVKPSARLSPMLLTVLLVTVNRQLTKDMPLLIGSVRGWIRLAGVVRVRSSQL